MSAAQHPVPVPPPPQVAPSPAPEVHYPRRRSWKWLIVLVVLIGAGVALWRWTSRQAAPEQAAVSPAIRTAAATFGTIQRTVRVGGITSAIDFVNVTAPIMRGREANSEMVLIQLAAGGSWVKKGTLVAQIDAQAMQDHIDDLGDTIAAAEADIRKRRAEHAIEWENLQQSLRIAKSNMDKMDLDLKASETQTEIQQQLAKLSADEARAAYKQLQADLAQKKAAHAADIRILQLTLRRHEEHRDRHLRDIKAFSIYAPMDGLVVLEQTFRGTEFAQIQQGDRLSPGQRFLKIVSTNKMQVEGVINQAESSEFRVGQRAVVKLDAFPGIEFPGHVYSMGALAVGGMRQSAYVRTIPIRIAIEGSHPKLIPDLSASADVILAKADNQVIVPLSAVRNVDGQTAVLVKSGNTFETRPVELGIRNETHVAIASGLKAGEIVRVN